MNMKEIQRKAAGIADELLRLEKDSGAMLAAPDSAADLAILKLQCKICLGQIGALEEKIRFLQEAIDTAEEEAADAAQIKADSIAATKVMLQQYLTILAMKKETVTAYLSTIREEKL